MLKKMVISVAAVAMLAVSAVPAHADPKFTPAATDLVGVGSDTTQDVLNALATGYNAAHPGKPKLASFDATPKGSKIKPKAGAATIERPDGSSAGIKALQNDADGALDFARSSRAKKADGTEAALTFFPFGQDGVTWATHYQTNAPKSLSKSQLASIYRCSAKARYWDQVGGKKVKGKRQKIQPYLPQLGSGTRSFFLGAIGLTDAQVGSCVNGKLQENDGKVLPKGNKNYIAAYSIGKWIAQAVNKKNDRHGTTVLHQIAKQNPTTGSLKIDKKGKVTGKNVRINTGDFPRTFLRFVFNVVRTADAAKFEPVFGATGWVCDQPGTIRAYGFEPLGGGCGLPQ